jgi:hypothetical protein
MKGKRGGAQPGAGRPKRVDEEFARKTCIAGIVAKYGSIEKGIEDILSGRDERLKLFIWQHVLGIPEATTKVKLSDNKGGKLPSNPLNGGVITVEVVRTVHNKDIPADGGTEN